MEKTENDLSLRQQGVNLIWSGALLCYCGVVFWLSDQPLLPVPMVFTSQDKLIHAAAYAIMAWFFWHAFSGYWLNHPSLLASAAVVFCSLYGITDEWHQSFVVGRDASAWDWLADTLGAIVLSGILLCKGRD
jgi:VanZ family protein